MPNGSSTSHLLHPKLMTVFGQGYGAEDFRKDVAAALTVAIVALPLSMAIAVASGVSPERGLYTSIVGGFLVSALGGSRFQIGGPAGAFIVLVAATGARYGLSGLLLTTFISGVMLTIIGLSRLGSLIRYIPHAVTVGFTCGIAATILASQIKDLAGLSLHVPEPGPLLPKLAVLSAAFHTLNPWALAISAGSAGMIFLLRYYRPAWPGMLVAVMAMSFLAFGFHLPVETIGMRFGDLPDRLPAPSLPRLSVASILEILPAALSFTLLGGVESLLSAKVADGMTGRIHRSNMELVAQGIANMASAIFGGISVTGTIARTATNVRAGARSPLSGMMHAFFMLIFLLVAARLAAYIPLSALAGLLLVVCWNMADKKEFGDLLRSPAGASVMLTTLVLTLIRDLTFGIVAGCVLAAVLALFHQKVEAEDA